MTRVGITGHLTLTKQARRSALDADPWLWVRAKLEEELALLPNSVVGISALAPGADQLFATAVLARGGMLEVILPFSDYGDYIPEKRDRQQYDALLQQAAKVIWAERHPPAPRAKAHAYWEAGKRIVDAAEEMFAVWERGRGGEEGTTFDVVGYIRSVDKPLTIVDPRSRSVIHERLQRPHTDR